MPNTHCTPSTYSQDTVEGSSSTTRMASIAMFDLDKVTDSFKAYILEQASKGDTGIPTPTPK